MVKDKIVASTENMNDAESPMDVSGENIIWNNCWFTVNFKKKYFKQY